MFKKQKEIDLGDDRYGRSLAGYLPAQVVHDELLVGGVEPEPRWQVELGLSISLPSHPRVSCKLDLSLPVLGLGFVEMLVVEIF
ncbi:hypothetical protein C4D60_Mb07t05630 [Musa balbisiana]|uniref:Uncharacterized protein n=1 Tax=Musa balbisiana TaxID=52838 RepID=A0A4S8JD66_MUSBA|nr:hypothetical protein C4D60_Mb07t05630 [Musa balbisiana]